MKILVVGVSGFIGRYIYNVLCQKGYQVTGCSRHVVPHTNWKKFDFSQGQEFWERQLRNVDVVINAAGIYKQTLLQRFSTVHDIGPKKLFAACNRLDINVIQISALGAEQENPQTEFLQSKRNADQYLLQQDRPHVVLYPGIVLGEQGRSTRQLSLLSRLYCIPLMFGKERELPLISIQQLTEQVISIIDDWPDKKQTKVLLAKPETITHLLINLHRWLALGKVCIVSMPESVTRFIFRLFPGFSLGTFNKQSFDLLTAYSSHSYTAISSELASDSLLKNPASSKFKNELQMEMLFYINLFVLGFIWVFSGVVSLINIEQSRELIGLMGINGVAADVIISLAAGMDILLGVLLLIARIRPWIIYSQIAVIILYSLIISIYLPMYWLHPFAPIVKNLALLMLAWTLLVQQRA